MAEANSSYRFVHNTTGSTSTLKVRSYVARSTNAPTVSKSRKRKRAVNVVFDVEVRDLVNDATTNPAPSTASKCSDSERELSDSQSDSLISKPPPPPPPPPCLLTPLSGKSSLSLSKSPLYYKPYMSTVFANYVLHLAVAVPELDVGACLPLLQTSWLPLVVGDPVLFQIIMLFSASHYASYQHPDQYQAMYIELLQLKQIALSGLIRALAATPTSGVVSDNLIAGTAKMGSYEAIYGSVDAYHAHMEGVRRMLQLRGGIQSLGQEGFLARLLHFIDTNSAFLLGTHLHLADSMLPRREPFVLPNPRRFLGLPG